MSMPVRIDDQPISATFFGEGKYLTSFVTPDDLEVKQLHKNLTEGVGDTEQRLIACWDWVANEIRYVTFVKAKMWVNGKSSVQTDLWQEPSLVTRTKVGNCANKSFILASLVRNELPASQVHVVLGNLHQPPGAGGHAWVEVDFDGDNYIMESTRGDMQPLVKHRVADVYEDVIYFNDEEVSAITGRTLLTPFKAVYASWLKDYLDWAFIEGRK
jgi:hypothetical protein